MGDVVSLVERAQENIDQKRSREDGGETPQSRLQSRRLPRADAADQKLGSMQSILGMMPGMNGIKIDDGAEKTMARNRKRLSKSMTIQERRKPEILNGNRRLRIAKRLWRQNRRSESTAEAIPANAADDEDVQRRGGKKMMRQMEAMRGKGGFPGMLRVINSIFGADRFAEKKSLPYTLIGSTPMTNDKSLETKVLTHARLKKSEHMVGIEGSRLIKLRQALQTVHWKGRQHRRSGKGYSNTYTNQVLGRLKQRS